MVEVLNSPISEVQKSMARMFHTFFSLCYLPCIRIRDEKVQDWSGFPD